MAFYQNILNRHAKILHEICNAFIDKSILPVNVFYLKPQVEKRPMLFSFLIRYKYGY